LGLTASQSFGGLFDGGEGRRRPSVSSFDETQRVCAVPAFPFAPPESPEISEVKRVKIHTNHDLGDYVS
jgi:hypothetical protein